MNFVVCLLMPMTQKRVWFTPHALCRTCGWNQKQNIDIYLQSKNHTGRASQSGKYCVIEQQCYFSITAILQWCFRFINIIHKIFDIYIYAFSRRFYPKRLTIAFRLYIFSLVCVFPGNRTHNLLRCWHNALPLSHTGTCDIAYLYFKLK